MTGAEPTPLPFDRYLSVLSGAADQLVADAAEAGLDAQVPTCPEWTVADLVGHVGTVHHWATAIIAGARADTELDPESEARTVPPSDPAGLVGWFSDGASALATALRDAPDDLTAAVFLHAAPPPRLFWARRQAHETTIHRVDALGAALGRFPTAAETGIDVGFACDGIDEMLTGFLPRRSIRLRSDVPLRVLVAPTDSDRSWTIAISDEAPVTAAGADPDRPADAVLTGSAAAVYLGLWNRGDEISSSGAPGVLGLWRDRVRVTWG